MLIFLGGGGFLLGVSGFDFSRHPVEMVAGVLLLAAYYPLSRVF
jgi:hypothetical protein